MTSGDILGRSLEELRQTQTSIKWALAAPGVIPAWVAEMDAQPCPPVVRAVTAAIERGDTGYPDATMLTAAWSSFSTDRWAFTPAPEAMMLVADVMIGLTELVRHLTREGGPVLMSPPVYPSFRGFVDAADRVVRDVPLGADGRLDLPGLRDAFVAVARERDRLGPAVFLLCNPHNPTGTVHTRHELTQLAAAAREYGITVVSDEIHAPLVFPGVTFTPYLSVEDTGPDFAIVSASKSWNLAGLKAALVIGGAQTARGDRTVGGLAEVHTHGASHIAVIAQAAALTEGRDWLDTVVAEIVQRQSLFASTLATVCPSVVVHPAESTYLAWVDTRAAGLGADPARALLRDGSVFASSGIDFGPGGAGHLRVNVATAPDTVATIAERIGHVVAVAARRGSGADEPGRA